jgi:hypothetical protein
MITSSLNCIINAGVVRYFIDMLENITDNLYEKIY